MAAPPRPDPAEETNPLVALLRGCVVRLEEHDKVLGTGFFVAPGEVLTCAHVVHSHPGVRAVWSEDCYPVADVTALPALGEDDPAAGFYPLPDAALVRLEDPPENHPCAALDLREPALGPPADVLRLEGFTVGEHAAAAVVASGATTHYEGPLDEGDWRLLKLKDGQVLGGFSGAPLLNIRTGGVCAIVESSRGERSELGGFGVPLAGVLPDLPGLAERNGAHHAGDDSWALALKEDRRLAALRSQDRPLTEFPVLHADTFANPQPGLPFELRSELRLLTELVEQNVLIEEAAVRIQFERYMQFKRRPSR